MDQDSNISPANQAASPLNGVVPPVHARFQPGRSGNPAGRPKNAGATLKEWVNQFAADGLTEKQIRKIADNQDEPWPRRAAAVRVLRTMESPDIADYSDLLAGASTLSELKQQGVRTDGIKKIKQKSRKVAVGDGEFEEVIDREIELHDRSGEDFDRIADRTDGKPKQSIEMQADVRTEQTLEIIKVIYDSPEALERALDLERSYSQSSGAGVSPDGERT